MTPSIWDQRGKIYHSLMTPFWRKLSRLGFFLSFSPSKQIYKLENYHFIIWTCCVWIFSLNSLHVDFFSPWNFYIDFYPCETDLAHGTFRTLIFVLGDSCVIFLYFKWVTYKFVKLVAGCFFSSWNWFCPRNL